MENGVVPDRAVSIDVSMSPNGDICRYRYLGANSCARGNAYVGAYGCRTVYENGRFEPCGNRDGVQLPPDGSWADANRELAFGGEVAEAGARTKIGGPDPGEPLPVGVSVVNEAKKIEVIHGLGVMLIVHVRHYVEQLSTVASGAEDY